MRLGGLGGLLGPDVLEILRESPGALRDGLREFHPADVADLLDGIPREDRVRVLENLDAETLGNLLVYLGGESLKIALTRLAPEPLGHALDTLESDDGARILSFLPEEKRIPVLAKMSALDAAAARGLLSYERATAGRLMTGKLVRVNPGWTAGETLGHLRRIDPEVATVADLYAVDESGRLVGVVSLRKLLPAAPEKPLAALLTTEVISVPPTASQDEVARLVSKYGFNALPVVDDGGRVLGIVTVDDVVDLLVNRETEDALRMGGVATPGHEPWERGTLDYFGTPILKVVRGRLGWLLLLFAAETLTGTVLRHYEAQLAKVVALSIFIPLIIGTGGNAGSQTVSTLIRALALRQVRFRDGFRVLYRESVNGVSLGVLLGGFAVGRAFLWGSGFRLSVVVGASILAVCAWANVVGSVVPLLAERLGIDPTLVSAPLITTLVDATGLAIYLSLAKLLLGI